MALRHAYPAPSSSSLCRSKILSDSSFHGSSLALRPLPLPPSIALPSPLASARLLLPVQTFMETHLDFQIDLKSFLTSKASAINLALQQALPPSFSDTLPDSSLLASGKRVRSVLCLAACELVGGTADTAMPAACAVEMIHKVSVLFDDMGEEESKGDRRMALIAGNTVLAFAFGHIAKETEGVAPEKLTRVIRELGKAAGVDGLVSGLVVEKATQGDPTVDLEVLDYIHLHKTAALLEGSVVSGAILGGGSEAAVERLRRYARFVSLLFRIVVDILDDASLSSTERGRRISYTQLLGLERSKQLARQWNRQAKDQLDMFDPIKAAPLHNLADYVVDLIDRTQIPTP